jgi:V-type H+-transporting ATPase 16kDa proteolipid subunit
MYTYSGYLGASSCMILSSWGSAWGTWRAGLGVCNMGVDHPSGIIKNIVPIVMAGVLGIYGLIVAVIITQQVSMPINSGGGDGGATNTYSTYNGYTHFAAGLCCGLSCLAAGGTIGVLGDAGVRGFGMKASNGRKWYMTDSGMDGTGGGGGGDDVGGGGGGRANSGPEGANKLYVGMLIMLIFSEALALYGLIVALILSQHDYKCGV